MASRSDLFNDPELSEARERFVSFGREVEASEVPDLVRGGTTIMSWGYGDGFADEDGFNAIEESDLDIFEDDVAAAALDWGPFRVWED